MNNDYNLYQVPLSWLSSESQNLLSCLLNTTKIIASDGPEKLPRDWRGLASLAQISAEIASSINLYPDKTAKVLEIWMSQSQNTAYVGYLLQFLQRLDRYDVYDDCLELHLRGKLIETPNQNIRQVALNHQVSDKLITYDDQRWGEPQYYHAFLLFATEDKEFADKILQKTREKKLRLCTLDDLLPGHTTQHAAVVELINERCRYIVLVYSPEFLKSPENNFYTDYAQAVSIRNNERKVVPVIYKDCILPKPITYYHKLYYSPDQKSPYNFWAKLCQSLEINNMPSIASSNHSMLKITEINTRKMLHPEHIQMNTNGTFESRPVSNGYTKSHLELPDVPTKSTSLSALDTRSISQTSEDDKRSQHSINLTKTKKKTNRIKNFINSFGKKKNKKAIPQDG